MKRLVRPQVVFLLILSWWFSPVWAETLTLAGLVHDGCGRLQPLGAFQVGQSIIVPTLDYGHYEPLASEGGQACPQIVTMVAAEVPINGPVLVARPLMDGPIASGAGVEVLTVLDDVVADYDYGAEGLKAQSVIGPVDASHYPWVDSYYYGWLYVVVGESLSTSYVSTQYFGVEERHGREESLPDVISTNTFWFYTQEGEWLYTHALLTPYVWNATREEWLQLN